MITPFGELPDKLAVDMSLAEQHEWLQRRISRRAVLGAGLAGAVALPWLWSRPAYAATATDIYGQHVSYGRDPTSELIVRFASAAPVRTATLAVMSGTGHRVDADVEFQPVAGTTAVYGRATLSGLTPGSDYQTTLTVDGTPITGRPVRTATAGAHPFRFTAFGDQGNSTDAKPLLEQQLSLNPSFHVFTGDISYADQSGRGGPGDVFLPRAWDSWLRQNQPYFGSTPWMFAIGNHEMEPGFDLHGYAGVLARVSLGGQSPVAVATATQYRVGSVGFIALDGNDVSYELAGNRGWTNGAQTAWLESTLTTMRAAGSGIEFIVVYLHQAPYSTNAAHGSDFGVREHWVPLFDRFTVDLVLSGHNHCYERTLPLRGGKVTSTDSSHVSSHLGSTYIVAGGGGQPATPMFSGGGKTSVVIGPKGYIAEPADWSLPSRTGAHALVCVDVEPSSAGADPRMLVRAIDSSGVVIDRVTLTRPVGPVAASAPSGRDSVSSWLWPSVGAGGALALGGGVLAAWQHRRGPSEPITAEDSGETDAEVDV